MSRQTANPTTRMPANERNASLRIYKRYAQKISIFFEIWGCAFYEDKEACTHSASAFTMLACNMCA